MDLKAWTRLHNVSFSENIMFRMSTLIRSLGELKKENPFVRAISKGWGFGERIHWFGVEGRPIRIQIYAVSKISGFVWTENHTKSYGERIIRK